MLELQNISYLVEDEAKEKGILKNVSFKIDDRFVAITGPNGGGKSTLAKVIAGIVKPTSGRILLTASTLPTSPLQKGQTWGSVMPSSSPCGSRVLRSRI